MEGVEQPSLKPTGIHQQIRRNATSILGRLMENPHDEEAMALLKEVNVHIMHENRVLKVPETELTSFTIDIAAFTAIFKTAADFTKRLRKSHTGRRGTNKV